MSKDFKEANLIGLFKYSKLVETVCLKSLLLGICLTYKVLVRSMNGLEGLLVLEEAGSTEVSDFVDDLLSSLGVTEEPHDVVGLEIPVHNVPLSQVIPPSRLM